MCLRSLWLDEPGTLAWVVPVEHRLVLKLKRRALRKEQTRSGYHLAQLLAEASAVTLVVGDSDDVVVVADDVDGGEKVQERRGDGCRLKEEGRRSR